jgi:hypothetical protein
MGIAIVPSRKWPNESHPRAFLDLESKLTWVAPSASDDELGIALIGAFGRCE